MHRVASVNHAYMLGIAHNGDAKFLLCAILSEYREYESTDLTLCCTDINFKGDGGGNTDNKPLGLVRVMMEQYKFNFVGRVDVALLL
ncbi:hypothetical protein [Methyloglobulus morosus]|nr:hypothetical protein [Methyloglobulus morosus]